MIKSMTGFGRGIHQAEGKEFQIEIKTVNHRYSDVFVKIPRQISFLEERVRNLAGKSLSRGKADVYITYNEFGEESKSVLLDEGLSKAYIKAFELLRDRYGLKDDISVSLISRFPDILKVEKNEEDEEKIWEILKVALDNALDTLVSMRENEGHELKINLLERLSFINCLLKEIAERSPEVIKEYKQKLEGRIKELLGQQTVDETRLAMEVAIFADRCSIDEETVRLESHINQFKDALNIEQQIGRKLDFIVQEMNREINTIGSKANDLYITKRVVELKSEIEKIREQIQNIE